MQSRVEAFKINGFTIFPGAIGSFALNQCRSYLREFQSVHPEKWRLGGIIELDPSLAITLSAHSEILDFAESVMGPFVQLDGLTIVGLGPVTQGGVKATVSGWHRDPWGQVPRSTAFERPLAMNALCYLQDLTDETGPLRIIRGSHRLPLMMRREQTRLPHPQEEKIELRAGDFVLLHNNLIHTGSLPSPGTQERDFVSVFYNLTWLRPTIQFAGPRAQELRLRFKAERNFRMLRLLGCDEHLLERGDTGFLSDDEEMWEQWRSEERNQ
jgi:hypothetical protein